MRGEGSHSRKLAAYFQERGAEANPDGQVSLRDLGAEPPPHLSDAVSSARFTAFWPRLLVLLLRLRPARART